MEKIYQYYYFFGRFYPVYPYDVDEKRKFFHLDKYSICVLNKKLDLLGVIDKTKSANYVRKLAEERRANLIGKYAFGLLDYPNKNYSLHLKLNYFFMHYPEEELETIHKKFKAKEFNGFVISAAERKKRYLC